MDTPLWLQQDKQGHFKAAAIIALASALVADYFAELWLSALVGVALAMLAEAGKIVLIDMPLAKRQSRPMNWVEKAWDAVAQLLGALVGAAISVGLFLFWR